MNIEKRIFSNFPLGKNKKISLEIILVFVVLSAYVAAEGLIKTNEGDIKLEPASGNVIVNGNVGIGTTSPTWGRLDVRGTVASVESTGAYGVTILPSTTLQKIYSNYGAGGGDTDLVLGTYANSANQLYLDTSGNVGIGTTSPGAKLHISQASGTALKFDNRQLLTFNANTNPETSGNIIGGMGFYGFGVSHGQFHYKAGKGFEMLDVSADAPGIDHASTSFAPLYLSSLYTTGNVGIGTTSPGTKLHVYNNIIGNTQGISLDRPNNTNYEAALMFKTAGSVDWWYGTDNDGKNKLYIWRSGPGFVQTWDTSGNVGIGTTGPGTKLHVQHSSSKQLPNNVEGLFVESGGSSNSYFVFQTATSGGGKSFSVTNAGNVGIGTTNPKYKLDVNGESSIGGVLVNNDILAIAGVAFWESVVAATWNGGTLVDSREPPGYGSSTSFNGNDVCRTNDGFNTCVGVRYYYRYGQGSHSGGAWDPNNKGCSVTLDPVNTYPYTKRYSPCDYSSSSTSNSCHIGWNYHTYAVYCK